MRTPKLEKNAPNHGTIIQTKVTHKKIIEFNMALK